MKRFILIFLILTITVQAQLLSISGDVWKNPIRTKIWTPPATTDTLMGLAQDETVSGVKTFSAQLVSTLGIGTAPFLITSTTLVPNLYVERSELSDTTTLNADLSGDVTSSGSNETTIPTDTITSTMILDDTILDADVNSSAAIDRTKLASGTINIILANDGSGVMSEASGVTNSTNEITFSNTKHLAINIETDSATTGVDASLAAILAGAYRLTNVSLTSLANIPAGSDGQQLEIFNRVGASFIIKDSSAVLGTAANRILTGTGTEMTLAIDASVLLAYDSTTDRWQVVGGSGGGSAGNLTGAITSTGLATLLGSFTSDNLLTAITNETGSGLAVFNDTPTFITPILGAATGTSLSVSGQLTSTIAIGTAPLVITSTTLVPNLHVARATLSDTVTTNANLSGEATSSGSNAVTLTNSAVIGKVLTGFSSAAGTIAAGDSILVAFNKANGNTALKLGLTKSDVDGAAVATIQLNVPNSQLTTVGTNIRRLETGNENLLINPSFEHSTPDSGWTLSGCTSQTETTIKNHGDRSLRITCSAQTLKIYQDSTLNATHLTRQNAQRSIQIYSTVLGVSVCSGASTVASTTNCVNVNQLNEFGEYQAPAPIEASNGLYIVSSGAITGDIYLDDAKIDTNIAIGTQDQSRIAGESYFAGTANCAGWVRTSTTLTGFPTDTDCPGPTIVRSSMGIWETTDSNLPRQTITNLPFGMYEATFIASFHPSDTAQNQIAAIYDGATLCKPQASNRNAGQTGLTLICTFFYSSAGTRNFEIYVASGGGSQTIDNRDTPSEGMNTKFILKYLGTGQVYTAQCGANCTELFTATIGATGVVSEESPVGWISGNCTNADPRVCTYDSGIFTVAPACYGDNENITAYSAATSTSVDNTAQITKLSCAKTGADRILARTLIASFNEVMTVAGVTKPISRTGIINCDATAAIPFQKGTSWISSITNISAGSCTVTLVTGAFSDTPDCTLTWYFTGAMSTGIIVGGGASSATSVFIDAEDDASTAVSAFDATLNCEGSL